MSQEIQRGGTPLPAPLTTPSLFERPAHFQKPIAFNGLLTNRILSALPGEEFADLLPFLEPVSLVSGQYVCEAGECMDFVYFPETAVISHLHYLADGSSAATSIVGNDGVVGLNTLFDAARTWCWAEVTVAGNALRMKPEILRAEFARGGSVQRLLLNSMRDRLTQLSQRAVCHGRHIMRERLCTWLLMICDRAAEQPLTLTHEKIAQHLGARRAGISGACNALRDLGIIRYKRGQLQIVNRDLLARLACECYGALQPVKKC